MSETAAHRAAPSRRDFLGTTGAAVAAAALPLSSAVAQGPAKYRRVNVTSPQAGPVLASYKKAIRAMLALPPSDPRNWYRNALTHTLDCPHGNWWFLVWHRGYIGWFEQICRELSGDQQFALPYWDWTQEPRVPAAMYDDVLTPNDPAFIAKATDFKSKFEGPVASYWNGLNNAQIGQLLNRGLRFPADLWFDINDDPRGGMFFEPPIARGLTKEKPGLDVDPDVLKAVSLPTLLNALSPRDFITFGSARTAFHSGLTGSGVLEGQPHNLVHNCVGGAYNTPPTGGFMQANLSPVDPLFFLHHANIDRLWDVWTRKQKAFSLPTLPDGFENSGETAHRLGALVERAVPVLRQRQRRRGRQEEGGRLCRHRRFQLRLPAGLGRRGGAAGCCRRAGSGRDPPLQREYRELFRHRGGRHFGISARDASSRRAASRGRCAEAVCQGHDLGSARGAHRQVPGPRG